MSVKNPFRFSTMAGAMALLLPLGLPSLAHGQTASTPDQKVDATTPSTAQLRDDDRSTLQNSPIGATKLDGTTSTGTRTQEKADKIPFTVDIVDQEKIEQRRPSTLDDLLRDIPGVDAGGGPRRSAEGPVVRGLDSSRLLITLDGARQKFDAGHQGGVFIDPDLLKQVDVLKGGSSVLYGSGALGGVIALTTKDARDFLDPGETAGVRLKTGYRSANKEWLYGTTFFAAPAKGVDLLANLTRRDGKNYRLGDGSTLDFSSDDVWSGVFKIGVEPIKHQKFSLSGLFFNDKGKLPSNASLGEPSNESPLVDRTSKQRQLVFNYDGSDPTTPLFNPHLSVYNVEVRVTDERLPPLSPRLDVSKQNVFGFDAYNTSKLMLGDTPNNLTYGVSYYHESQIGTRNGLPRPAYPDAQGDVAGFFIQDQISLSDTLSIVAGVRYDHYSRSSAVAEKQEKGAVSPRLGVLWQATPWLGLYGNVGWAFRAPALTELYVSGFHFPPFPGNPTGNVFVPNPDLKPETSFGYEGGVRLRFGDLLTGGDRLRITGALYDNYYKDFINLVVTCLDIFCAGSSTYVNVPRAHIYGAEAQVQYDTRYWFAGLGFSAVRGKDQDSNDWLEAMPADKIVGTIGAKLPSMDMILGWRSEFNFKQHRVQDPALRTASYFINGVFASWAPSEGLLRNLRLDVGIDNLFDVSYRRHLAGVKEPGVDYGAAVSYTLKF